MWSNSPNKAERDRRRQDVPRTTILNILSVSVPSEMKAWIWNEAARREIPHSWLVTEIVRLGIETYELMGKNTEIHEYGAVTRLDSRGQTCGVCRVLPATKRDPAQGWVCDGCG